MKSKFNIKLLYILYLFIVLEGFLTLANPIFKEKMFFTSDFIPPSSWNPKFFDAELGWTSENRLNYGGILDCFGDSFTYGDEVNEDETWPYLLNKNTIRTSNYGVKAYGTDQAFLRAKKNIKNNSKILLLSFISESIRRNMTIYRPFYSPTDKGKFFYTKPKFFLNDGSVEFFPNINSEVNDRENIRSVSFLKKINTHEYYPQFSNTPDDSFPQLRLLFQRAFWNHFYRAFINNEIIKAKHFGENLWIDEDALRIQDHILNLFINMAKKYQKTPIIMHFPNKFEMIDYRLDKTVPDSILHTKNFCENVDAICWFPLIESPTLNSADIETLFLENGHYSKSGNRHIFEYVSTKLKELNLVE